MSKYRARTNYVRIADMPGLKKSVALFGDIDIVEHRAGEGRYCFFASGGFPSMAWLTPEQAAGGPDEIEFSWSEHIMPFVAEGEVLVLIEVGAEAYMRIGGRVRQTFLSLQDIYAQAAAEFEVDVESITNTY